MTPFQHLLVLVSIIIGLALTDVLNSLHSLLMARDRVRFHWLPLAWAFLVFVAVTQYWWAFFRAGQDYALTQFFAFLFVLIELTSLYIAASMVLPDIEASAGTVDLERHYFDNRQWFFGLLALYVTLTVVERLIRGHELMDPGHGVNAAGVLMAVVLMKSRSPRVHAVAAGLAVLMFFLFIVRYTLRIQ